MTQPHCPTAFRPKLHQCSVLKNCWTGTFVSWQNGPSFELYNFLLPLMFITVVLLASLERITMLEVILPSASHSCHLPLPGTVKASVQSERQEHHLLPVLELGYLPEYDYMLLCSHNTPIFSYCPALQLGIPPLSVTLCFSSCPLRHPSRKYPVSPALICLSQHQNNKAAVLNQFLKLVARYRLCKRVTW